MADQFIAFDPSADVGERLAPEVRSEIAAVAPSTVVNGSITTAKLADNAVTEVKISPGAVTSSKIAANGVDTVNLKPSAVSNSKIATGAVSPDKCSTGVVTSYYEGNPIATAIVYVTSAQYSAIASPDPNTVYFIF